MLKPKKIQEAQLPWRQPASVVIMPFKVIQSGQFWY